MFDFDWETLVKLEYALHVCAYVFYMCACVCIAYVFLQRASVKIVRLQQGENKRVLPYLMASCTSVQRLKVRPFWFRPKYAHLPLPRPDPLW